MKHLRTTLFLLIGAFFFTSLTPALAITAASTETTVSVEQQKTDLKKAFKAEKRLNKLQKMLASSGIDFKDPVEKFLWFAVFGLGGGLALWLLNIAIGIGFVGYLAWALWVAGSVCLVIWIVKKFAS